MARDDMARLIFISDNSNATDPDAEWVAASTGSDGRECAHAVYAYRIADGLLAAGYVKPPEFGTTLDEVRAHLLEHRDKGTTCPACGQHVKVYRRTINGRMVKTLAAIWHANMDADNPRGYVHVPSLGVDSNHEVAQLGWRGLVEEATVNREDGGRPGYWRLTWHGLAWLKHGAQTPRYVTVYNGEVLGLSDELVTVTNVVRDRFDLSELLNRTTP